MVVVKKEYRGLGVGSYAINSCLNELSSTKNCHQIGLTTQLPENVTFYSRLGFEKIDEGEVCFKKSRYYNYNMRYKQERFHI
jgi:predicted GNAT family N-acyltransferase